MIIYCEDRMILNNVKIADHFVTKLIGLIPKSSLSSEEGLLLIKCPSIHTYFMKIPIDAVYLSKDLRVIDIETINPWKIGRYVKNSSHVLELDANSANQKLSIGECIFLRKDENF